MSKIKLTKQVNLAVGTAAVCALPSLWAANAAPQTPAAKPAASHNQAGATSIDNYAVFRYEPSERPRVSQWTLTGPRLVITSPRYKMAAPNIRLMVRDNNFVLTGEATGGVQVTVKDTTGNQTTQVACNTAAYTAGATQNLGRIDLKGMVRSKTYSPGLAQPLVSESESGFIQFTSNGPVVQLNNGSATVTPIEPTPAPPAPKKP